MSICWLYLIAYEVVSVLKALGLLASVSTGNINNGSCMHGCRILELQCKTAIFLRVL